MILQYAAAAIVTAGIACASAEKSRPMLSTALATRLVGSCNFKSFCFSLFKKNRFQNHIHQKAIYEYMIIYGSHIYMTYLVIIIVRFVSTSLAE